MQISLTNIRTDYKKGTLDEKEVDKSPFLQFDQWFKVNYPRDHPQFVQEIRSAMARMAAR